MVYIVYLMSSICYYVGRRGETLLKAILNDSHLSDVLLPAIEKSRHRLFIATANLKDVHLPSKQRRGKARSLIELLKKKAKGGVEIRILHSGVPSVPVLERLRKGLPENLTMRRCPRVHAKAIIVDGRYMYLGSANFTGAGLGAKSSRRRNFEAGIWTDDLSLIDPVADMLEEVWTGALCDDCGRQDNCPVPLEEPDLARK